MKTKKQTKAAKSSSISIKNNKILGIALLSVAAIGIASFGLYLYEQIQTNRLYNSVEASAAGWTQLGNTRNIDGPMKYVKGAVCVSKAGKDGSSSYNKYRVLFTTGGKVPGNKTEGKPYYVVHNSKWKYASSGDPYHFEIAGGNGWWGGNMQLLDSKSTFMGSYQGTATTMTFYYKKGSGEKLWSNTTVKLDSVKSC